MCRLMLCQWMKQLKHDKLPFPTWALTNGRQLLHLYTSYHGWGNKSRVMEPLPQSISSYLRKYCDSHYVCAIRKISILLTYPLWASPLPYGHSFPQMHRSPTTVHCTCYWWGTCQDRYSKILAQFNLCNQRVINILNNIFDKRWFNFVSWMKRWKEKGEAIFILTYILQ